MHKDAPWLDLAIADLGLAEIKGARDNPNVMRLFRDCGHPEVEHDETAWCAAFVGSCLKRAGLPLPPRSINLMARSYRQYGVACVPKAGAIAVWPRGAPPSGHVNIVVEVRDDGTVKCVDGNHGDKVAYSYHSISSALDFRWPVAATSKALRDAGSTEMLTAAVLKRAAAVSLGVSGAGAAVNESAVPAVVAPAAQPVVPISAGPDLSALPDLHSVSEQLTAGKAVLEGIHALRELLVANPWLAGALVGCLATWFVAHVMERNRVARAALGAPLSVEVASLDTVET